MDIVFIVKLYICVFLPLVLLTAFVWPIWRNYKRSGINPLVFRRGDDSTYGFVGQVFKWLTITIFLQAICFVAWPAGYVYLVAIPYLEALPALKWVGMGLSFVSLMLTVVAQTQMGASWRIGIDTEHRTELVARGVFRFSRNPIYLSMIGLTAGLLLMLPNALSFAIWLCTFVVLHIQVRLEEEHMRTLHPEAHAAYCRRVRRWL